MDVFVIPVGPARYELYCEQPAEPEEVEAREPPAGIIGKLRHRLTTTLRAAEERRHRELADEEPKGWIGRLQDRMMAWVAERIAEQRLLWNLRTQSAATVAYPQDMGFDEVMTIVRSALRHDYERHRRWMIVDGIAFVLTFVLLGPLFFLIPGVANLPALYFGFRVVGHWLSMRGATQGLTGVEWSGRPCPPLDDLREVPTLEPHVRVERIGAVAARLRLQHLATFFDRVALSQAR